MSKRETKALAIVGGICTIGAAVSAAKQTKQWKNAHTFFSLVGAVVTLIGVFA